MLMPSKSITLNKLRDNATRYAQFINFGVQPKARFYTLSY
jgi:hypothetical protein